MRLFVAAELPQELLDALAETIADLRDCVRGRFVAIDSLHVTLAFLGEVERHRIPLLCATIDKACQGHAAFDAQLACFGNFGKRSKAALWQGFRDEADFARLASDVRSALKREGFRFDEKNYRPHVTLMRGVDLSAGKLPSPRLAAGQIASVALFESDLSGSRPVYTALHRVELTDMGL